MNEKLRNHVNVLFAAVPKTARAAEMKEELLANLNARYDDLLKSGYDSTAAFHIALSGIGDLEELFKEFRQESQIPPTAPGNGTTNGSFQNVPPEVAFVQPPSSSFPAWLIGVALAMFPLGIAIAAFFDHHSYSHRFTPSALFICWAIGIGLIAYLIARAALSGSRPQGPVPQDPTAPVSYTVVNPWGTCTVVQSAVPSDTANKKVVAGILAILLGCFGIHKFYLGFTGSGLAMLLLTVLSFGVLSPITWTIGLIEGVVYLTKSDRDFYLDYVIYKRSWF